MPAHASPFALPDDAPFLAALNSAILAAHQVQDLPADLHKLNRHEQLFIGVDTFLTNADADGVSHFFYYDIGDLSEQVRLGLEEIGAQEASVGLARYVARVFGGEVPKGAAARQDVIEALAEGVEDEAAGMVGDLAGVASRLAAWARVHREQFRV